jgi:hypothetical protein
VDTHVKTWQRKRKEAREQQSANPSVYDAPASVENDEGAASDVDMDLEDGI